MSFLNPEGDTEAGIQSWPDTSRADLGWPDTYNVDQGGLKYVACDSTVWN